MNGVAKTSLLTAAMRAAETQRSDSEGRLFNDPLAEVLAGEEGKELLQKAIQASGPQPAIAIRTFFIDHKFNQAVKKGIRQIVILAAGMDSRAFRLDFPDNTVLFELDQVEVFKYKNEKLKQTAPRCRRKAISLDLRGDWNEVLIKSGFKRSTPTLWLVEGLLMYLEEADVRSIFEKINDLASPGDIALLDILSQDLLLSPYMKNQLDFLSSIGAPWKFGTNEPEKFFESLGWKAEVSQTGEVVPDRWPFPVAPRNIPNVPRGFLVEARKI